MTKPINPSDPYIDGTYVLGTHNPLFNEAKSMLAKGDANHKVATMTGLRIETVEVIENSINK